MQINTSQTSFKSIQYTPRALEAMSKRMPSSQFIHMQERLNKMYKESPLDIIIYTTGAKSHRLCANIKQQSFNNLKKIKPQYIKESILSSIFSKPEKFLDKLCKEIDKNEVYILGTRSRGGRELMV